MNLSALIEHLQFMQKHFGDGTIEAVRPWVLSDDELLAEPGLSGTRLIKGFGADPDKYELLYIQN